MTDEYLKQVILNKCVAKLLDLKETLLTIEKINAQPQSKFSVVVDMCINEIEEIKKDLRDDR